MDRRTIRHPQFAVILPLTLGAMLLLTTAATAQNTFTPTVDNDLANPANWSLGTLPSSTDTVIIDFGSSPTLTLSVDLELGPVSLIGSGEFDLTGHELIFNPGIEQAGPLPSGPSQFTFQGGSWQGNFNKFDTISRNPGSSIVWDNSHYVGQFNLQSIGDAHIHITNGSDLTVGGLVKAINNGPLPSNLNVRIDGGSKVAGAKSGSAIVQNGWVIGGEQSTNVVVTEGAELIGGKFYFGLPPVFPPTHTEVVFENGAKGSPSTNILVGGASSTTKITGEATHLELYSIKTATDPLSISLAALTNRAAELVVESGASLSLRALGAPNIPIVVEGPFNEFSFASQLRVVGDGSTVDSGEAPHQFVFAEVKDGATLRSDVHNGVLAALVVDHASVIGDVQNSVITQNIVHVIFGSERNEVVVNHGSITGSVSNYRFLALDHGLIDGSVVDVTTIEGNGHITGDVVEGVFNVPLETIDPNGLIQIDGDVGNLFSVDEFHFEGRGGVNDQIWIGGLILGLDAFPVRDFANSLLFTFAPTFQSSVGDRYELLRIDGTPLRLIPGADIPPDLVQTILDADFDPEGLPEGYGIRMFLEDHALGFTVTSVPEVSSVQLLAGLFAGALVVGRWRLGRRA